jgi:hypothetical protein
MVIDSASRRRNGATSPYVVFSVRELEADPMRMAYAEIVC